MEKKFEKDYTQLNHKDPKVGKAVEKKIMESMVKRALKEISEKD